MGILAILNVGDGDTKLTFDKDKPEERERAATIVAEMLRKGFAILIEVKVGDEKLYKRVTGFDPATCEYIIAGDPGADLAVSAAVMPEAPPKLADPKDEVAPRRGRRRAESRVPADGTRATSVARSAGGCHRDTRYVRRSR